MLQFATEPAHQLMAVEARAVDGDDEVPRFLLGGQRGRHDVELVVRYLVTSVDLAAVDLLGDAQIGRLRLPLQARQEHEVVVALPEQRRFGAAIDESVEAQLGDEGLGESWSTAEQPAGGGATAGPLHG